MEHAETTRKCFLRAQKTIQIKNISSLNVQGNELGNSQIRQGQKEKKNPSLILNTKTTTEEEEPFISLSVLKTIEKSN